MREIGECGGADMKTKEWEEDRKTKKERRQAERGRIKTCNHIQPEASRFQARRKCFPPRSKPA